MTPILFRLDANSQIGLGHLGRCLALADALRHQNVTVQFALSRASSDAAAERARGCGYEVQVLPVDDPGCDQDSLCSAAATAALGSNLVVLDGYAFRGAMLSRVRGHGLRVAYIDDVVTGSFDADVFVNPSLHGAECTVSLPAGGILLLGPRYSLIRAAFVAARERRRLTPTPFGNSALEVVVSIGGTDPGLVSLRVLESLQRLGPGVAERLSVRLLLSASFGGWKEARMLSEQAPCKVSLLETVPELADILVDADIAVVSASTVLAEVSTVGIAAVAVAVVDNQEPVAEAASRLEVACVVDGSPNDFARALDELVRNAEARERMVSRQLQTVDGLGAARVADVLAAL